jgi:hypothetical protein
VRGGWRSWPRSPPVGGRRRQQATGRQRPRNWPGLQPWAGQNGRSQRHRYEVAPFDAGCGWRCGQATVSRAAAVQDSGCWPGGARDIWRRRSRSCANSDSYPDPAPQPHWFGRATRCSNGLTRLCSAAANRLREGAILALHDARTPAGTLAGRRTAGWPRRCCSCARHRGTSGPFNRLGSPRRPATMIEPSGMMSM